MTDFNKLVREATEIDPRLRTVAEASVSSDAKVLKALWQAWMELNTIRARDGVPWTHYGRSDVSEEYFSTVVDDCEEAIRLLTGDDPKPWSPV